MNVRGTTKLFGLAVVLLITVPFFLRLVASHDPRLQSRRARVHSLGLVRVERHGPLPRLLRPPHALVPLLPFHVLPLLRCRESAGRSGGLPVFRAPADVGLCRRRPCRHVLPRTSVSRRAHGTRRGASPQQRRVLFFEEPRGARRRPRGRARRRRGTPLARRLPPRSRGRGDCLRERSRPRRRHHAHPESALHRTRLRARGAMAPVRSSLARRALPDASPSWRSRRWGFSCPSGRRSAISRPETPSGISSKRTSS